MGNSIATAYVQVIPTTDGIQGELDNQLGGAGESAGKKAGGKFGSVFKKTMAVAGIGATFMSAVSAAVANSAKKTAEYGDTIDKMSQKMGMSAQAYQEWDFIMQHNGTTIESMKASMKTLANAAEKNNDAFSRLGITQEQMASMSQEELFGATIKGLQNVTDTTERTYLAGQLLGRGATELGPLLNMTAEETEEMRKQVHDLGGVMSDKAVKASAAFQDSLQNLQTAFGGLKRGMTGEFLPSITEVMDGLTLLFSGENSGLGKIKSGVSDFTNNLIEKIPRVAEVGVSIFDSLFSAIISNLPTLINAASNIMSALPGALSGIITTLAPALIPAGVGLIVSLVGGLSSSVPQLLTAIVGLIPQISSQIIEGLPQILDAGLQLFLGIVNAIPQIIPPLVQALPQITYQIVTTLFGMAPQIFSATVSSLWSIVKAIPSVIGSVAASAMGIGVNLVRGIWNGIAGNVSWLIGKIKGFCSNALSAIKDFFGIHSPSRETAWMGEMLTAGLAEGIDSNLGVVEKAVEDMGNTTLGTLSPMINGNLNVASSNSTDVIGAINDVKRAIANLGLYLDGDTLVGGIAERMDNKLGQTALDSGRFAMA